MWGDAAMYLFSRRGRIDGGHTNDALAWATGITAKVNEITDLEVGLWMQSFSPEFGTIVWSTFLADLATLEAAGDKLAERSRLRRHERRGREVHLGWPRRRPGPDPPRQPRPEPHRRVRQRASRPSAPRARSPMRWPSASRSPRRPRWSPGCRRCSAPTLTGRLRRRRLDHGLREHRRARRRATGARLRSQLGRTWSTRRPAASTPKTPSITDAADLPPRSPDRQRGLGSRPT